jgi:hypothetical protein
MAYNVVFPVKVISAGNMGAASITSSVLNIQNQDNLGIQFIWTGTPTGTFGFEVSLNHKEGPNGNTLVEGDWSPIAIPGIVASGSAGNAYVGLNQVGAPFIRVTYTRTSGTGTLNAYISAKGT